MSGLATVDYADLEWEADGAPRSKQFHDIYFSRDGGLAESTYVYLQGNGIPERWPQHFARYPAFHLFEAGFGTGLNFLLTWRAFLAGNPPSGQRLRYVAVERFPLRRTDLAKALMLFPELAEFANQLIAQYPPALRGWHSLQFANQRVELLLVFDDICAALPALAQTEWRFDAWYLDGFAPKKNAAMWADSLWPIIAGLSRTDATASSFSAVGHVRRGLASAGFSVTRAPGFGRKFHMTVAKRLTDKNATTESTPRKQQSVENVLVLGAGIAGAASARALAERGIPVTVLDQQQQIGGTLRHHSVALASPRWSRDHNARSRFQLHGFLLLQSGIARLTSGQSAQLDFHDEVLTLMTPAESPRERAVLTELGLLGECADWLTAEQASTLAGTPIRLEAVCHRLALAVDPAALCAALLQHPNITVETAVTIQQLDAQPEGCALTSTTGRRFAATDVIIAGGADCRALLAPLPLRPVRGQSTTLPVIAQSQGLRRPLRFGGYLTPVHQGVHTLGASYDGGVFDPDMRAESQQENLDTLASALPELAAAWRAAPLAGDVGHRLVTPDRAPIVGAHPTLPHVWLNLAHGSHALMTACSGASLLAAQLLNEPASLPADLIQTVAPARFRHYFTAS